MGEFREATLGDVLELKRGYDLPQQDRRPGSVPIVSSSGITARHAVAMVKGPGVITGRYGTLGQVFYIPDEFWPLNTTLYVRDFKGNDPRFVSYFLRSLDFNAYSDKAAVPGLNRNDLHQAHVKYPTDRGEQRAIASILATLDDKLDCNLTMNATLSTMALACFEDWFVAFGPTRAKLQGRTPYLSPAIWSLFPDRLDDQGMPEGWAVSAIGREVDVVGGSTPSTKVHEYWGGDIAWATPKDLSSLSSPVLLSTARTITNAGLSQIGSGLLPAGTVLLSSRAPIGYLAITQVPTAVNQGFIAMTCRGRLSNVFVWLWARTNMTAILQNANGSTFQEISKASFRPLRVPIASSDVLRAFDETVKPLFEKIIANDKEGCALAATRDLLLPKLMSGALRVQDAEGVAEAVL